MLFLVVGVTAVVLSVGIRSGGVTSAHDPGPRFVPLILGWILVVGGLWEVFGVVWRNRRGGAADSSLPEANRPAGPAWSFGVGRRAVEFVLGFPIYLAAMSWLGFHLATGLMVTALLLRLEVIWWRAMLAGAVLVGAVHLLFGIVFRVALPAGFWS